MVKYLQLDGVDDYIKTPLITFNEVIMDFSSTWGSNKYILDARAGTPTYIQWSDVANQLRVFSSNGWYVNGTKITTESTSVSDNQRIVLRFVNTTAGTDDVNFFSANNNFGKWNGNVYDIKFHNNGTIIAHYDMSTGTVQDQTGNGNHATLTGGTWLDDGTGGGTGIIHDGTSSILSSSLFNSSGIPIHLSNGTINGLSSFSSNAIPIISSNSTIIGYGTLSATSTVGSQILASAILNGSSLIDSNGIGLRLGNSQSIGYSSMNSIGNYLTQSNSSILGSSLVSVTVGSQSLASAIIQSTTNVTVNGLKQLIGISQVNGLSSTSFNGVRVILSDSGIDVNSDLNANIIKLINLDSSINSISGLTSDSIKLISASSNIDVHSTFSVFVGNKYVQVIPIAIDIKRNELIVTNIHRSESIVTNIKRKSAIQVKI